MTHAWLRTTFLIALVVAISAAFLTMVRMFLLTLLLAAILAGLARPLYLRVERRFHRRRRAASAATIALLLAALLVPLMLLGAAVAREAVAISTGIGPWIEARLAQVELLRGPLLSQATQMIGALAAWTAERLSTVTVTTLLFFFHFFILIYALFFFLKDGPRMLQAMLAYVPLADADKARMLDRFTSVARATLKGTVFVGAVQGTLSGLAFWVAGIDGALFWMVTMMVSSILPGIGGALIWVPAVVLLAAQGALWKAVGLAAFCALVVGSVDNVLRPRLVGHDARMPDVLVLISTLGGLVTFGATGFIVGPILAALFLTVWEMFGATFRDELGQPTVRRVPRRRERDGARQRSRLSPSVHAQLDRHSRARSGPVHPQ